MAAARRTLTSCTSSNATHGRIWGIWTSRSPWRIPAPSPSPTPSNAPTFSAPPGKSTSTSATNSTWTWTAWSASRASLRLRHRRLRTLGSEFAHQVDRGGRGFELGLLEGRPPEIILGGEVRAVIGQVLHDVAGSLLDRGMERCGTALGSGIHIQPQLHHQLHGIQLLAAGRQENSPGAVRQFRFGLCAQLEEFLNHRDVPGLRPVS